MRGQHRLEVAPVLSRAVRAGVASHVSFQEKSSTEDRSEIVGETTSVPGKLMFGTPQRGCCGNRGLLVGCPLIF
jgi:hypothetical protein